MLLSLESTSVFRAVLNDFVCCFLGICSQSTVAKSRARHERKHDDHSHLKSAKASRADKKRSFAKLLNEHKRVHTDQKRTLIHTLTRTHITLISTASQRFICQFKFKCTSRGRKESKKFECSTTGHTHFGHTPKQTACGNTYVCICACINVCMYVFYACACMCMYGSRYACTSMYACVRLYVHGSVECTHAYVVIPHARMNQPYHTYECTGILSHLGITAIRCGTTSTPLASH